VRAAGSANTRPARSAAVAAVAAWIGARASGAGRHVDVSIFEAMIAIGPVFADLNGQFVGGPCRCISTRPASSPRPTAGSASRP
jgi:crotonobetainyl-CoA:carnitine CoA-transferase CaiB-like acyl-CoA transferase